MQGRRSLIKGEPPDKPPRSANIVENIALDGSNTGPKERGQKISDRVADGKQVEIIDDRLEELEKERRQESHRTVDRVAASERREMVNEQMLAMITDSISDSMARMSEELVR